MIPLRTMLWAACGTCVTALSVAQVPLCVDPSFRSEFLAGNIAGIALMDNGQLIVGGMLWHPSWFLAKAKGRLDPDGGLDTTFEVGWSGGGDVRIHGDRHFYQRVTSGWVRYFIADGTLDLDYFPRIDTPEFELTGGDLHILPNGSQWLTGAHSRLFYDAEGNETGNEPGYGLVEVLPDGRTATDFDHKYTAPGWLTTIYETTDGRFLFGVTNAATYEGRPVSGMIRTWPDGRLDTTFTANFKSWGDVLPAFYHYPDGRMLVFGNFMAPEYPDDTVQVLRLFPDGRTDASWPNIDFRYEAAYFSGFGTIMGMLEVEPGRLLVVGQFDQVDGRPVGCIAAIDTAGNVLWDYLPGAGAGVIQQHNYTERYLSGIEQAPDGAIYIYGAYHGFDDGCGPNPDQRLVTRLYPLDVGGAERADDHTVLRIWPNPGWGQVDVAWDGQGPATIRFHDLQGRQVLQGSGSGATSIDVSSLSEGIYTVSATRRDGTRSTMKWNKQ